MRKHVILKQDRDAVSPVIAIIITVALVIAIVGIAILIFGISPDSRKMICGEDLGPATWLEILVNEENPLETTLDPLEWWEQPIIPDDIESIVFKIMYEGAIAGVARLYSLYPNLAVPFLVVSVALYVACELSEDEAKSYGDATNEGLKIALLIGLEAKKGDDIFFPSFSIELEFSEDSGEYSVSDMSLEDGAEPDLEGLDSEDFPLKLRKLVGGRMIPITPTR
jgi:FlaG/FlaF family flagellin (archaellin)